jgi:two-component system nitrate/nitrite response regulator NarL
MSLSYQILIVDRYALLRDIMTEFFTKEFDCANAKAVPDISSAIDLLQKDTFDLVLLDGDFMTEPATAFFECMARVSVSVPVLVLSAGMNQITVRRLLALGAAGIAWKTSTMQELSACVREVVRGATSKNSEFLRRALRGAPKGLPAFSERQAQVLKGIAAAQSNKEIAANLGVTETSVKCTVQQIFGKLGVRTRTELVRVLLERFPDDFVQNMVDAFSNPHGVANDKTLTTTGVNRASL